MPKNCIFKNLSNRLSIYYLISTTMIAKYKTEIMFKSFWLKTGKIFT